MARRDMERMTRALMDDNLKRAFREPEEDDVPDRFALLLEQLHHKLDEPATVENLAEHRSVRETRQTGTPARKTAFS